VPLRDALLGTLSLPIEQQSIGCSVVFSDAMSLHGDVSGEVQHGVTHLFLLFPTG
jgi:hypothetical protein